MLQHLHQFTLRLLLVLYVLFNVHQFDTLELIEEYEEFTALAQRTPCKGDSLMIDGEALVEVLYVERLTPVEIPQENEETVLLDEPVSKQQIHTSIFLEHLGPPPKSFS